MADNGMAPMADVALLPGYRVVLEALDPTTGAAVAGVKVSAVVISGQTITADGDVFIEVGPARLIPGPGA